MSILNTQRAREKEQFLFTFRQAVFTEYSKLYIYIYTHKRRLNNWTSQESTKAGTEGWYKTQHVGLRKYRVSMPKKMRSEVYVTHLKDSTY